MKKRQRTTHSDLARELEIIVRKLSDGHGGIPLNRTAVDPSSLRCITDAARILVEQDERIAELTVALREQRSTA
jgi:hypothetical protein